ncbi:hypothetical protein [Solidesulfovibrio magneticus]|uniref:Uncharacterized protein n=1 Tax=Solidesulfovibrio magneticus (strain ATCC 700980 / DSM 13731 / RS-1) TaxID=573370 RepID=C4XUN6_SOLM1|nr:hypothetical protein [Solidesulfovibrio magneticus]BAH73487.1 hypothetical protein DMR_p2_00060 [Solidesulfovibrio magneticus RS-1]
MHYRHTKKFIEKFFKTYKSNEIDNIVVTNFDEAEFVCILQIVIRLLQIDQSKLEAMLDLKKKTLSDIFNMYDENCKRKRNVRYETRFGIYQSLINVLNIFWAKVKANISKRDVGMAYNLKHVENIKKDMEKLENKNINEWTKKVSLKIS